MKYMNIYQDEHSGGWIAEVLIYGEWTRIGVYGTRSAAYMAVRTPIGYH